MMPSIGDDIVDLKAVEPPLHSRYIERVFSQTEQKILLLQSQKLWLYWAAKEAAYKALSRGRKDLVFSPILFEFNEELSVVNYQEIQVKCICKITEDYIHVSSYQDNLSKHNSIAINSWIGELPHDIDSSIYVRECIVKQLSTNLNISPALISVSSSSKNKRGGTNPPTIRVEGADKIHQVSISHHGRFVSFTLSTIS